LTDAGFWGILAPEAAFSRSRKWLEPVREHFHDQTTRLQNLLKEYLPGGEFPRPKASFLACRVLPTPDSTEEPADAFLREARVALKPGINFGAVGQGCARLNMGTSAERLERIVTAMGQVWPPHAG